MTTFTTPKTLSIDEAAKRTGLSPKALRSRIDRGTLRSIKDSDGKRRIALIDLQRCGLIDLDGVTSGVGMGHLPRRVSPAGVDIAALLEKVIAAEVKAATAQQLAEFAGVNAEQDRRRIADLEQQVFALSADLEAARNARRRWFSRKGK